MNSRFPGKGEIVEESKPEDFAVLGALFETPAMVSVEGKIASNDFTIHLEGDLGIKCDPRRKKAVLYLGSPGSRLSRASAYRERESVSRVSRENVERDNREYRERERIESERAYREYPERM
jgi:hypothetical protein